MQEGLGAKKFLINILTSCIRIIEVQRSFVLFGKISFHENLILWIRNIGMQEGFAHNILISLLGS